MPDLMFDDIPEAPTDLSFDDIPAVGETGTWGETKKAGIRGLTQNLPQMIGGGLEAAGHVVRDLPVPRLGQEGVDRANRMLEGGLTRIGAKELATEARARAGEPVVATIPNAEMPVGEDIGDINKAVSKLAPATKPQAMPLKGARDSVGKLAGDLGKGVESARQKAGALLSRGGAELQGVAERFARDHPEYAVPPEFAQRTVMENLKADPVKTIAILSAENWPNMLATIGAYVAGGPAAAALTSIGLEGGDQWTEGKAFLEKKYGSLEAVPPEAWAELAQASTVVGIAAGSIDVLPVANLFKRAGLSKKFTGELTKELMKRPVLRKAIIEGAKTTGQGMSAEAIQELIQIAGQESIGNNKTLEQKFNQVLGAVVAAGPSSFVTGSAIGAAGQFKANRQAQQTTEIAPQTTETAPAEWDVVDEQPAEPFIIQDQQLAADTIEPVNPDIAAPQQAPAARRGAGEFTEPMPGYAEPVNTAAVAEQTAAKQRQEAADSLRKIESYQSRNTATNEALDRAQREQERQKASDLENLANAAQDTRVQEAIDRANVLNRINPPEESAMKAAFEKAKRAGQQEGDLVRGNGQPFGGKGSAELYIKSKKLVGHVPVQIGNKAWVVRPQEAPAVTKKEIDTAAHEAATSPKNDLPEPTEGQKQAGNYKVGKITLHGLPISIENPKGAVRSGTAPDGSKWETKMKSHYGYVRGSEGADGDPVDVFLTDGAEDQNRPVFVIDQVDPNTGKMDEHKAVIGAATEDEARQKYLENYESGWQGIGGIKKMSLPEFKAWVDSGNTDKPLTNLPEAKNAIVNTEAEKSNAGRVPRQQDQGSNENTQESGVRLREGGPKESPFEIVPVGEKTFVVRGEKEAVRSKLADAGVKHKGIYSVKHGGLAFPVAQRAAVEKALQPTKDVTDMHVGETTKAPEKADISSQQKPPIDQQKQEDKADKIEDKETKGETMYSRRRKVTRLDASEIPAFEDKRDLMKQVFEFAKKNLIGKTIRNEDTGDAIKIPQSGIKKTLGHSAIGGPRTDHQLSILKLDELLKKARRAQVHDDGKGRNEIKAIHRYATKFEVDGRRYDVEIVVRENFDGKLFYSHMLTKEEPRNRTGNMTHGDIGALDESAKDSKHSIGQKRQNFKVSDIRKALEVRFGKRADKIEVVQSEADLPAGVEKGGVAGVYHRGKVYLVADNLTTDQAPAVALHEAFHSTLENDPKLQARKDALLQRLGTLRRISRNGKGEVAKWFKEAEAAVPEGTPAGHVTEEIGAYAIEQYEKTPTSLPGTIAKWAKDLIAAVRVAMMKAGLYTPKTVTPADLAALAKSWIKRMSSVEGMEAMPDGALVALHSRKPDGNIDAMTQKEGSGDNLTEQSPEPESEEFKRWFGGSEVVDDAGKPLVVYHGTDNAITGPFDFERLGENTYSNASDSAIAATSAVGFWFNSGEIKEAANSPYSRYEAALLTIKNPLRFDSVDELAETLRPIIPEEFEDYDEITKAVRKWVNEQQEEGYDGVILDDEEFGGTSFIAFSPDQIRLNPNPSQRTQGAGEPKYSRRRITGNSGRDYTKSQQAAFESTGRTQETPSIKQRVAEILDNAGMKLRQGIVDQFAPIADLDRHAYTLARLSKASDGALEAFLLHGRLKLRNGVYDADMSGGVINRLLKPLKGEMDDFMWWVAANRAERLAGEGREHLFSPQDIAAYKSLATGKADFDYTLQHDIGPARAGTITRNRTLIYKDAAKTMDEMNRNVMDIAEQSDLIDGQSRALWEKEFYIPFYRAMEDGVGGPNIRKSGLVRQYAFKQLKGGKGKLNHDLIANTIQNWAHLLSASAKNRAAKATLEAAERVDAAHRLPYGAPKPKKGAVYFMGYLDKPIPAGRKYLENGVEKVSDGTATIREHGEVHFAVDDPFLLDAVTALEWNGYKGPAMKVMGKFKHYLTIGVTANPAFKIRNLIRDSITAVGQSDLSPNIAKNIKQGLKATSKKRQTYVSMLASGGVIKFGSMIEGSRADHVRQLVDAGVDAATILDSDHKVKAFWRKYIKPVVDAYNELGDRGESINRAALYEQLIANGMDHAEASLAARDLLDFSMGGTWSSVRLLTQVVPFMNARLQGLYKLGRSDKKRLGYVVGAVSLASLALLAAYQDDEDWKKREDWDRDSYWWFKFGGMAFRLPKPFEIGAIGTVAERTAELFFDNEMTGERYMKRLGKIVGDQLSMNPIPQLVKPVLDVYANTDSFTGRPIETMGMERLRPEDRYTQRTSEIAKLLGKSELLSPVQIDHLIRGYFGWLGTATTTSVDILARSTVVDVPPAPAMKLRNMFLVGNFVETLPADASRYVSQMYDQSREIEQAYASIQYYRKLGEVDKAREILEENRDKVKKYKLVMKTKQLEAKVNRRIRQIEARRDIDSQTKRDLLNKLYAQRDKIARRLAQK